MKTLLSTLALLFIAATAHAQGPLTAINFRQYVVGAAAPLTPPFTIALTAVVCNQAVPPVLALHSLVWDDPDNPTKVCIWIDAGTGPLFAKVYGALEATISNLAGTLESAESTPRTPFTSPLVAPKNLKVAR